MIQFFKNLTTLTPVQHLIQYWWLWLLYTLILFTIALIPFKAKR